MNVNCTWIQDEMSAYERGGLTAAEREAVRQHLTACAHCQRAARADAAISMALDELPTLTASPDFARRVRAAVRAEAPPARRVKLVVWAWAAPLAAAVIGAAGLYLYTDSTANRDRDVIAELDMLEQIEILGSDLALEKSASALDLLAKGGALPAVLASSEEEGL